MEEIFREESDSLGSIWVKADRYWGAQTERSLKNFSIGKEKMPIEVIHAIGVIKRAAAEANYQLGFLSEDRARGIISVCDELIQGELDKHFPLSLWQTGSGTQTHMNVNEVIANRAIEKSGGVMGSKTPIHPNDHVNGSQSSNDVFPTAMHIAAVKLIHECLIPHLEEFLKEIEEKSAVFNDVVKVGRTHLMDAAPLTVGQEFSGYGDQIRYGLEQLYHALESLYPLALGGTAVGTGLNCPQGFDELAIQKIREMTGHPFRAARNRFAALASHDPLVQMSGVLKLLATSFMKIGNDIRWLASGPRCGLGELILPSNEPGSSIMPGKVNPTQCEALTMIAAQVMGNDVTIGIAGSMGNFELNVFKPVIIHNLLQSIRLLGEGIKSFHDHCFKGIELNRVRIEKMVENSLMVATALNPVIGYDKAAKVVQMAHQEDISLKEAAFRLKFLSYQQFDQVVDVKKMV
ncbi:MAG: class II fumarate hydratase [Candidatus Rhabdochlamydia sp.]